MTTTTPHTCPTCGTDLPAPTHYRGSVAVCGECFATRTAAEFDAARAIAWDREETDPCEAGTPGCSINHTADRGDGCETW